MSTSKAGKFNNFSREQLLAKKAADPSAVICEYTHVAPEATMDVQEQTELFRAISTAFDAAVKTNPTACDEALRERVLAYKPRTARLRLFARLYSKLFAMTTTRVHDAAAATKLDSVRKMTMYALQLRGQAPASGTAGAGAGGGGGGEGAATPQDDRGALFTALAIRLATRDMTPDEKASVGGDAGAAAAAAVTEKALRDNGIDPSLMTPLTADALGASTVYQ